MSPRQRSGQTEGPGAGSGASAAEDAAEGRVLIDRLLARRGTRHNTLGPTGARVFCSELENAFGLRGRFALLHDEGGAEVLRDPLRLSVTVDGEPLEGSRAACMWYPSHARRQVREHALGLLEEKFISWDDVLCDVVTLTNHGDRPLSVRLQVRTAASESLTRTGKDTLMLSRTLHGQRAWLLLAMRATRSAPADTLTCELRLRAGEQVTLLAALAVGLRQSEAQRALGRWAGCDDPVAEQQRQYQRWFDRNCPRFECPDQHLTRLWWYRWFVVRHNLAAPGAGELRGPVCYPGKAPRLARLSAADGYLQLAELRWLRDPGLLHSQVAAYLHCQSEGGQYRDGRVDATPEPPAAGEGPDLAVGLVAAMVEALWVQPQPELLPALADSAVRNLSATRRERDPDNDLLLQDTREALARVDSTALFAASLLAAGGLLAAVGRRVDAQWHEGLGQRCAAALRELLWDDWDRFFYDRRLPEREPWRHRQARALLPLALGLTAGEARYAEALGALTDEAQLATAHGPAAAAPGEGGRRVILPALAALTARALAAASQAAESGLHKQLRDLALLACEEGDGDRPQAREAYEAASGTGEGALDVFVSNCNDLLIQLVAGVRPRPDEVLQVAPLPLGLSHFRLEGLPYRGHLVTVVWDNRPEGERYPEVAAGLTVLVDGAIAAQTPGLEPLLLPLAAPGERKD